MWYVPAVYVLQTIGGYVAAAVNKSNYDLSPLLVVYQCSAMVASADGKSREVQLTEEFFAQGDVLDQPCLITDVMIPLSEGVSMGKVD